MAILKSLKIKTHQELLDFQSLITSLIENDLLFDFSKQNKFTNEELISLLLTLIPHISPNFLMDIIQEHMPEEGYFIEFGGVKGKNHRGIIPTGETLLFILAGDDIEKRAEYHYLFSEDHLFAKKDIIRLEEVPEGEPRMSGKLIMNPDYVEYFITGKMPKPKLGSDFPAQLINTELEWDDLIISEKTANQISEIEIWLKHNHTLMNEWGMHKNIKPGYKVLLSGPPGTGKTLTAALLGKYTERDVYRIDLSMMVSKYIGETEKNLSRLFDKAKNKDWILFFDEADALFGKRTGVKDSNDKYANQEVSYLLQRIESHDGLVVLASNYKKNIDAAFTRRFNSIIEFSNPTAQERVRLWKNNIPAKATLDEKINIEEIAERFELTGANIVNVIHYACLKTIENGSTCIQSDDLLGGIQKEYQKEGRMVNVRLN